MSVTLGNRIISRKTDCFALPRAPNSDRLKTVCSFKSLFSGSSRAERFTVNEGIGVRFLSGEPIRVWCNGNTTVSKTADESPILSTFAKYSRVVER